MSRKSRNMVSARGLDQLDLSMPATVGMLAVTFGAWLARAADEELHVAHLAADGRLLGVGSAHGRANMVELPVRRILAEALLHDATGLVLAHNHPSGDPMPSRADLAATYRLADAARDVGVHVLDHLVFGGGHWRSFRAMGLL